jgi:hypothetical protein
MKAAMAQTTSTPRQPAIAAIGPATTPPAICPLMPKIRIRDSATCRYFSDTASPMMASVSGIMPPAAMPEAARNAISQPKLAETAAASSMMPSIATQIMTIRRLPMESATGPRIGCTRAKGRV